MVTREPASIAVAVASRFAVSGVLIREPLQIIEIHRYGRILLQCRRKSSSIPIRRISFGVPASIGQTDHETSAVRFSYLSPSVAYFLPISFPWQCRRQRRHHHNVFSTRFHIFMIHRLRRRSRLAEQIDTGIISTEVYHFGRMYDALQQRYGCGCRTDHST